MRLLGSEMGIRGRCQCTTGYSKVLFEKAFGCDVDVELLKSIKCGDDICLMRIVPHGVIWG